MKNFKIEQSKLWEHINQMQITKDKIQDLKDFKSSDVNFRITLWDPKTNGLRYVKLLLYYIAASMPSEIFNKILKIKNRDFGNPITIKRNSEEICLDYLQAVFELDFIEQHIRIDGLSILEIGAGYGRTCHSIISNHKIKSYSIIDLENCLNLSCRYLKKVLNKSDFSKLNFVEVKDFNLLDNSFFDLCINIDSFAEMEPDVVKYYLEYINQNCHYFYVKNPVGKYMDKSLDNHYQGQELVNIALNTGVLRDVIDIHDNQAIKKKAPKFIEAYHPGKKWECIANSWARPWSYFWQAIYKKNKG